MWRSNRRLFTPQNCNKQMDVRHGGSSVHRIMLGIPFGHNGKSFQQITGIYAEIIPAA